MTAIWHNGGSGWRLLAPSGFPAEAALHDLVEEAPQMLPLAGAPRLVVVGREVLLGGNYADLIAVEPSGRLAVVEIKLARNAEARRAVVAQVLTYAAYLRGMAPSSFERDILDRYLRDRGHDYLTDAVAAIDQAAQSSPEPGRHEQAILTDDKVHRGSVSHPLGVPPIAPVLLGLGSRP